MLIRRKKVDKFNTSTIFAIVLWYQTIPRWFQSLFPSLTWQVPEDDKVVYLTFDDGPHPEITKWVVEILEQNGMKASFFVVGDNARKYPDTLRLTKEKGHSIGNHTMHHIKGWKSSTSEYLTDIDACEHYFTTNLFRPPYGQIKWNQIQKLKHKYKIVMWSILSCDFDQKLHQEKALLGLIENTKKGAIVVFHDSVKAEKNLKYLLPKYLEFLKNNGYTCRAL